jgi:Kef-type K+ transport system membrane component KefB/nucleotide-binding universal stress UspA family protein
MPALVHDPITRFIAQLFAIILVSRVLGVVAKAIGQPLVIAEVSAGILLGPSLLGIVWPAGFETLFTKASLPVLQLVSQLGLMLFMFLVGLELDFKLLKGRAHTSVVISHSSIIVPFVLGVLLAFYLRPRLSEPGVPFLSFALFLGAAMSITAFPVLARILAERRLLKTRLGAVTIACAAVDDVTAWCILAFVVATAKSTGLAGAVTTTAITVAYIGVMFIVVRPLLSRVGARVSRDRDITTNLLAVTIILLFISSWATELIGVHALFGAFIFGSVLPKEGGFAHAVSEKLGDVVVVVLLPLFFAYSGVRTRIQLLDTPGAWVLCALIIGVACLGKFGASTIAARVTGLTWRESSALGVLMNTRGLIELIVLNIGLDLGVISPTLFTMMVLMALVTTFLTTPLVNAIYPPERMTLDLLAHAAPPRPAIVPDGFTVVACVAFERSGPGLVALAGALGSGRKNTPLYALHLERPNPQAEPGAASEGAPQTDVFAPMLERAEALNLAVHPVSFESAAPADDICSVATVKRADLLLLGWHKPVVSQTLLGGTVYQVMKRAPSDVGVFMDRGLSRIRRILVPFLNTPHSHAALKIAHRVQQTSNCQVTVLHVIEPERRKKANLGVRDELDNVFYEDRENVTFKVVEHRSPARAALDESAAGYDLVIVGIGAEWGLHQRAFGLHSEQLMDRCPTSVLVVLQRSPALEARAAVTELVRG